MFHSMNVGGISEEQFCVKTSLQEFPVIELVLWEILSQKNSGFQIHPDNGCVQADTMRDLLLLASVERHRQTGNIGVGLVTGFGLQRGALASSVAHDSHNIIVVGTNPRDMYTAVRHLENSARRIGCGERRSGAGRFAAANRPTHASGRKLFKKRESLMRPRILGVTVEHPFMQLSFLALPVIPENSRD